MYITSHNLSLRNHWTIPDYIPYNTGAKKATFCRAPGALNGNPTSYTAHNPSARRFFAEQA